MVIPGLRTYEVALGRLRIRFHPLIFLCLCSSLGMFISLGLWQLDRAEQKRSLAADLQQRFSAEPIGWQQLGSPNGSISNMTRVAVSGEYLNEISFLVLFQFYQGRAGYELVTPFRPADGGDLILISRGWLAPGITTERPDIPMVSGQQTVQAQIHVPEFDAPAGLVTDNDWPVRLPRMNVEQVVRLLDEPVYPYVLRLEADQPGVQSRHWVLPSFETRGHLAYAAQWFGIALLVAIAALLYASNLPAILKDNSKLQV